jgi:hypothetical protein
MMGAMGHQMMAGGGMNIPNINQGGGTGNLSMMNAMQPRMPAQVGPMRAQMRGKLRPVGGMAGGQQQMMHGGPAASGGQIYAGQPGTKTYTIRFLVRFVQ